ncbi:MAG: tetratricopeptide repeat protein, partial [Chitinophagaceae bacterium]
MEKYFAILIFLIFILSARSQKFVATQTTESLKKILIYKKDTQRVNILNQLSRPYLYSKHRQNNRAPALYYADEALTLARSLHYDKGIGNALLNKGILLMDQDYPNSLSSLQAALPFLKQTFDKYSLAVCFYNIGWCMHTFGENKKAILYYDSSLNLFEELKDTSAGAWVLAWTGHSHFDLGNYREAYETGEKARKWTNKSDTLLQTLTLAFLADLFLGAGLPEITVQYLPRILHFYPEMMDQKEVKVDWPLSWALERIGEAFLQLNQVDSALKIAQVLHIRFEKQDVTNHLFYGHVYAALGQYQNALPH